MLGGWLASAVRRRCGVYLVTLAASSKIADRGSTRLGGVLGVIQVVLPFTERLELVSCISIILCAQRASDAWSLAYRRSPSSVVGLLAILVRSAPLILVCTEDRLLDLHARKERRRDIERRKKSSGECEEGARTHPKSFALACVLQREKEGVLFFFFLFSDGHACSSN